MKNQLLVITVRYFIGNVSILKYSWKLFLTSPSGRPLSGRIQELQAHPLVQKHRIWLSQGGGEAGP